MWCAPLLSLQRQQQSPSSSTVVIDLLKMCCRFFSFFICLFRRKTKHTNAANATLWCCFSFLRSWVRDRDFDGEKKVYLLLNGANTLIKKRRPNSKSLSSRGKNNGPNKLLIKTHFPAIAFARSRVPHSKGTDWSRRWRRWWGCSKMYFVYVPDWLWLHLKRI